MSKRVDERTSSNSSCTEKPCSSTKTCIRTFMTDSKRGESCRITKQRKRGAVWALDSDMALLNLRREQETPGRCSLLSESQKCVVDHRTLANMQVERHYARLCLHNDTCCHSVCLSSLRSGHNLASSFTDCRSPSLAFNGVFQVKDHSHGQRHKA